jgi:hypothetical protein
MAMTKTMVRYKVRPDQAALNEELIRGVFDELDELQPEAFSYKVFVLDDGVSVVHIVEYDGSNPLPGLPSFKRYSADVRERLDDAPVFSELRELGSIASK